MGLQLSEVPDWARAGKTSYPTWAGAPRIYRFDGQDGQFYVGTEQVMRELWVQVIDWRWHDSERWGRQGQEWLDVAFVDTSHMVSVCAFKKASAVNVFDALCQVMAQQVDPMSMWMKLESKELRTTENEPYHVAVLGDTWNFCPVEQFESLKAFAESGLFQWHLVGEVAPRQPQQVKPAYLSDVY